MNFKKNTLLRNNIFVMLYGYLTKRCDFKVFLDGCLIPTLIKKIDLMYKIYIIS
jgi:hypothetical protein